MIDPLQLGFGGIAHFLTDEGTQKLQREYHRHKGIEEGIAVHADGQKLGGIFRQRGTGLIGDEDDLRPGIIGHFQSQLIHFRITGKADGNNAVLRRDIGKMVDHIQGGMGSFIDIGQHMLEHQEHLIANAAVGTGGDNKLPLALDDGLRRFFKIDGIVIADAGLQILHDVGKITADDIIPQFIDADFQALGRDGDAFGNAVDALRIFFTDGPLEIHKAPIAQSPGKTDDGRIADIQPLGDLRGSDETGFRKVIQNIFRNEFFFFCQLYAHELGSQFFCHVLSSICGAPIPDTLFLPIETH